MRIVFLGTGEIARPTFQSLLGTAWQPVALVTQPDKAVGRSSKLQPPAIKVDALEAGIPVLQPEKIRDEVDRIAAFAPDVIVVMAYGQILPQTLIDLPKVAIINLHASILPRWRGASCIQSAIDAGDEETGITIMHVVKRLDAGDVILDRRVRIGERETGGELHDRLALLGPETLAAALEQLAGGSATRTPQDDALVTYAAKLDREHGKLDWFQSATTIARRIRAYDPWPGTYAVLAASGKRLKVFPVQATKEASELKPGQLSLDGGAWVGCGNGAVLLGDVQAEGGRRMDATAWLRGLQQAGEFVLA